MEVWGEFRSNVQTFCERVALVITWSEYLVELHREKDLAYGDAWCRRGESVGIFTNIARKYDRWARIIGNPIAFSKGPESLDDTLADLMIYSVKYAMWLIDNHSETKDSRVGRLLDGASVADSIVLITELAVIEEPQRALMDSFELLEGYFVGKSSILDLPEDRLAASWSIARSAWAELHLLPVPEWSNKSAVDSTLSNTESSTTTNDLKTQLLASFAENPGTILLLGLTASALELRSSLISLGLERWLIGIAQPGMSADEALDVIGWNEVNQESPEYLVVTSDKEKQELLRLFSEKTNVDERLPRVLITGTRHLEYRDSVYSEYDLPALVPSYATGYPFTRVHMFECLSAAARNNLNGAIVEFGAFKGGTTAWLAKVASGLGLQGPILAFDSWDGFPPRRSLLDMYSHPRCIFSDYEAVRTYLEPLGVELVPGDISDTAPIRLKDVPVLLAFVDTDNYSPAKAALSTIRDNVVPGGAIVFDHFTTSSEYIYTLGERMAGHEFLRESNFLHIHGTGVFVRLSK
jgi:hypothetical protein